MTYEEIKEISSRFELFDEYFEDVKLDTENMGKEPEFCYYEAKVSIKTDDAKFEAVRIKIDEDPDCGSICIHKSRIFNLTFEQKAEQDKAYDVCKLILNDYLNDSII